MEITPFHEPESCTWTYLLADTATGSAAIIDPVWVYDLVSGLADRTFIDGVLATANERGYAIEWVFETHAHADHLTAADLIRQETGAPIAVGKGICAVQENFRTVFNLPDVATDGRQFDRLLDRGDVISVGTLEVSVMPVPGHTSDSIALVVGDAVFVGDSLFKPSYGTARCDFPGGDAGTLFDSIQRLHQLPDDTRLYLCHDYPGEGEEPVHSITVAESRRDNIHVGGNTDRESFIAMREARDTGLDLPRLIMPSLQVNIRAGALPEADDNGFTYLKMPFNATIPALLAADEETEESQTS